MRSMPFVLGLLVAAACGSSDGTDISSDPLLLVSVSTGTAVGCGLDAGGTAWCWGDHAYGKLGTTDFDTAGPVHIGPDSLRFIQLSVGGSHTCGVTAVGAVWCWGRDEHGQLGDGVTGAEVFSATPLKVSGLPPIAQVAAGHATTCALTAAGATWCWGANFKSIAGVAAGTHVLIPTLVHAGRVFTTIALGDYHGCGITSDSLVACWGWNGYGQLGQDTVDSVSSAAPLTITKPLHVTRLAVGQNSACAIAAGVLYCWGTDLVGLTSAERDTTNDGRVARVDAPAAVSDVRMRGFLTVITPTGGTPMLLYGDLSKFAVAGVYDLAPGIESMCGRDGTGMVYCLGYSDVATPPYFTDILRIVLKP